jgi:hypothetical protein
MRQPARNHHAVADAETYFLATCEFEIDPSLENVDELYVARFAANTFITSSPMWRMRPWLEVEFFLEPSRLIVLAT